MSRDTSREAQEREVLVDIGMPTLGASLYLVEALESVRAQTVTSWRLTISENGSGSEELRALLGEYASDHRIRHRVVGEHISMAANWTRSLEGGGAAYVAMLHDDDIWDKDFLARRIEFLETNPRCGFVFAGYTIIDESGDVVETVEHRVPHGVIPREMILPIIYENCIVAPPTPLVRRSAYRAVGPAFKDILLTDHDMWIRLAAHADVGYLPGSDSKYRVHRTQNTLRNRVRIGAGQLEVFDGLSSIPVAPSVQRRTRGKTHLLCAMDDVELGEPRRAVSHLRAAVRAYPSLLVRPRSVVRMLLVVLAIAGRAPGRRAFSALRQRRFLERGRRHAPSGAS
jgi:glycosyltransferase involved in cell wall biosynthesis